jgi:hypothetical protein
MGCLTTEVINVLSASLGRTRLRNVSSADYARAENINRVVWITIEGGTRPWDDLEELARDYSTAGASRRPLTL